MNSLETILTPWQSAPKRSFLLGTGACGAPRYGPMIRGMLGEEVQTCEVCGWSILKGPPPLVCPRCNVTRSGA